MIDVPVEVKDALREGTYKKNYRFVVLEEDGTASEIGTIDNDNLVKESVSIDERMCSGDTLKFGLCEGSSLEFQYFGKPNITGKRIQAFVDVQYLAGVIGRINASGSFTTPIDGSYVFEIKKGSATGLYVTFAGGGDIYIDFVLGQTSERLTLEVGDVVTLNNPSSNALFEVSADMWDTIPMGFFDVKKCSRQASTGIIKATCYNKLQSDYLDQKANNILLDEMDDKSLPLTIYSIRETLLKDFEIIERDEVEYLPRTNLSRWNEVKQEMQYTDLTWDKTPLCASNVHHHHSGAIPTLSGKLKISIYADRYEYSVHNGGYSQLKYLYKSLSELSDAFVLFLTRLIDDSHLTISGQNYVNGINNTTYSDYLSVDTKTGWSQLLSTAIQPVSPGQYTSYYSDYPYEHGQTISAHPIVGTMKDFQKRLFTRSDAEHIAVWIPTGLQVAYIFGNYSYQFIYSFGNGDLTYYDNNDNQQTYPGIYFNDGTVYVPDTFMEQLHFVLIKNLSEADVITVNPSSLPDFTLREITSASYETVCQFGQLSRTTDLFSGVELNHSRLYPADTLYPSDSLYPSGAAASGFRSMYSKLWADEGNVHKWRYLIITYKGLDGEGNEQDYTLQRTVNADGIDDYNCSDNWLFRNLVWTAEQIGEYADAMVAKMQDVTWFPFEMWCAGLPYLETGDEIEIPLGEQTYTSYILQRQLKGIQNLQDTYINGTLDIF